MNSFIQMVTDRLNKMKCDRPSIKEYLTFRNVLLLLMLLDICRIIGVFCQVSSPYNIGQMELNMSIFVGLGLVGIYGVYVEQKSLLFVYLSFYTGLIASSLFGSIRGFPHHSICCVLAYSGLQLALSVVLIWYMLTRMSSAEEANSPNEASRLKESTKSEKGIRSDESNQPAADIEPKEGIRSEKCTQLGEDIEPKRGIRPKESMQHAGDIDPKEGMRSEECT